jgi:hypothetical protein
MHIEFFKGSILTALMAMAQMGGTNNIDLKLFDVRTKEVRLCLRKTITALTKDGYITPTSTFGSTYTLNMERINQIQFK